GEGAGGDIDGLHEFATGNVIAASTTQDHTSIDGAASVNGGGADLTGNAASTTATQLGSVTTGSGPATASQNSSTQDSGSAGFDGGANRGVGADASIAHG